MSWVGDVLTWWVAQMRDLLPARSAYGLARRDAIVAELRPDGAPPVLTRRRRGRERPLSPAGAARLGGLRRAAIVRVPPGTVLERALSLPLATEAALPRVIAYEIDRISPFSAPEVAWTHAIERRDGAGGRLHVRLALLPRAMVQHGLAALRASGIDPVAVVAPRADGGMWHIGLVPPAPPSPWPRIGLALAAVLAVAAVIVPFARQQRELDAVQARIEALRPTVAEAEQLRQRIAGQAGSRDAVAAEAARVGDALALVATLAMILPDDTYLTALGMRQRVVTMSGRSASASRLLPLLAADPALRDAAFAAPVTRTDGPQPDVFTIRAEFRT